MHHDLCVFDDPDALSGAAAAYVAKLAVDTAGRDGTFHLAVSGGRSPWEMFGRLTEMDVPWEHTVLWQVDERIAPPGDPDRNLSHLRAALGGAAAEVRPMPVEDPDPAAAAHRYGAALPERFHLVHLGLGPDGHTASLVPGDAVLEVRDRPVAITASAYQGRHRMTFTYAALRRASQLLWLVTGEEKQGPLRRLLAGDMSIPASLVEAGASLVMADRAACPSGTAPS